MTDQFSRSGWPEDPENSLDGVDQPGRPTLMVLYGLPFLLLLLLPAVAWMGLFPVAVGLRWTTHPPHRRRLTWIYLMTALISVAPWVALIVRGDASELIG